MHLIINLSRVVLLVVGARFSLPCEPSNGDAQQTAKTRTARNGIENLIFFDTWFVLLAISLSSPTGMMTEQRICPFINVPNGHEHHKSFYLTNSFLTRNKLLFGIILTNSMMNSFLVVLETFSLEISSFSIESIFCNIPKWYIKQT